MEQWLTTQGVTAEGDDDHDGLSNLMEYATGSDPHANGFSQTNVQGATVSLGQPQFAFQPYISALFSRRKDRVASGLTYEIQGSGDLVNWYDATAQATVTAENGDYEVVSMPVLQPWPFLRLSITSP